MARGNKKIEKDLYYLRKKKRDLKKRIGQSMSDTGTHNVTGNCKDLQRELSLVNKQEKKKKQKLQRRYF